jgi:predicted Zn-dependent protease
MKVRMKSRSRSYFPMLLAIVIFLFSCAVGPGEMGLQPVEADRKMGQQVAKQVEEEIGIFEDASKTAYLDAIGQRLVRAHTDQRFVYRFQIVDQPESNAFAAPGGFVFVSRGLLALPNTEEELANVIGHEIIHVSQRHTAQQLAKARVPSLLALPGAIVGSVVSESVGNLINAPIVTLGAAYMAKHSRGDEFEADRLGQQLSGQAGYDPVALATILDRLEEEAELRTAEKRRPGFFDTHPTTPDRVRRLTGDAQKIAWSPQRGIARNSAEFLRKLDGLLVGENPAQGVFQGRRFFQPVLDFTIEFPAGWGALNTPKALFAFTKNKDALVLLGIAGKGTDPGHAAEQVIQAMSEEYKAKPSRSEPVKIGKLPAYLVTYSDTRGKEPMHLFFLYIAHGQFIYQFVGLAPERYRPVIRKAAQSFRPLTSAERASIRETRLRIVSARANETLARLSGRSGNVWDLNLTAVINGIRVDQPLKKGQLIKIAVEQPYRDGRRKQ